MSEVIEVQVTDTIFAARYPHGDIVIRDITNDGGEKARLLFTHDQYTKMNTALFPTVDPSTESEPVDPSPEETTETPEEVAPAA